MSKKVKTRIRRGRGEGFIRQAKNGRYEGRYTLHRKNGTACTVYFTRDTREQILDVFAKLREVGILDNDIRKVKVEKYTNDVMFIRNNAGSGSKRNK